MAKNKRQKSYPPADLLKEQKRLKKEKRAIAARERRKRINENPVEKAKAQMKQHLRYKKGKEDGKILLIKDLSKRERVALRQRERVNYRLRQQKKMMDEENSVKQASMNIKTEVSIDVDNGAATNLENSLQSSQDQAIGGSQADQRKISVASTSTSQNQICENNDFVIYLNNPVKRRSLRRIIWD